MRRLSVIAALAAGLCACNPASYRYSSDRAVWSEVPEAEVLDVPLRCDMRLCIEEAPSRDGRPGPVQSAVLARLAKNFSAVRLQPVPLPEECDLGLRYDSLMAGQYADLRSAHTGEFLARFESRHFAAMGSLVCRALNDGLAVKVPESAAARYRVAAPAPAVAAAAPAPSAQPALSPDDIARIAAAVKAAAPSPEAAAPAAPAAPRLPPLARPALFAAERPDDLAVVVGVESYSDIATKAPYAERDAEAFKAHVRSLGVPERNIVLLTGAKASRSALVKNVEGWLPRLAKPGSRVYFYFSGHGAPDPRNGTAYLVPWDGDPNFLDATGYPVSELYRRLGELPAAQVLVALDSCFSGAGGRSVLPSGARPLVSRIAPVALPPKLTVLTASASNEISGSLDDKGHGAFTWFLLEGLNAGKRSAKELHAYLLPRVQDESRRLNRDQTPQLLGADAALR